MSSGDLVVIGQVTRPHGIRGEIRVRTFTTAPEAFDRYDRLILRRTGRDDEFVSVTESRPHKSAVLLCLKEVRSREEAEALVGAELLVPRRDLPDLEDDEFYWVDLIGLAAYDEKNEPVGLVRHIFTTGADDILVLENGREERLVPFRSEMIREVDLENGRLVIRPREEIPEE